MANRSHLIAVILAAGALLPGAAFAAPFTFSTGNPDGLIATASRPLSTGKIETESADDFVLDQQTALSGGTFTGLIPTVARLSDIGNVIVEIYRVFPLDSVNPPSGNVPNRANSPSDVAFDSRDASAGQLSFAAAVLAGSFTALNSVVNGINPLPNQFTGGEGAVTGQEVRFSFTFQLANGDFLWLSAPKPIGADGTPFTPDPQSWIRNENLSPDWLRIGTDITRQGPFNAAFSLVGATVPEPATWTMMIAGFCLAGGALRRTRRTTVNYA